MEETVHEKRNFPSRISSVNVTKYEGSHLLKKSLIENLFFCAVKEVVYKRNAYV